MILLPHKIDQNDMKINIVKVFKHTLKCIPFDDAQSKLQLISQKVYKFLFSLYTLHTNEIETQKLKSKILPDFIINIENETKLEVCVRLLCHVFYLAPLTEITMKLTEILSDFDTLSEFDECKIDEKVLYDFCKLLLL
jgi:hypothetical protein